jgi:hypothetical protein
VAAKKKSAPADKDLQRTVKKLRSQLDRADARADKWKKRAAQLEKSVALSEARAKKLSKKLAKASSSPTAAPIPALAEADGPTDVADSPTTDSSEVADAAAPDAGWTVVQLRAEARSRGLTGLSGKSKAQLLEALT